LSVVPPVPVLTFVQGPVADVPVCQRYERPVIGAFGSEAVSAFVLPEQIGLLVLMAEVLITGTCGVPLQAAGTPSNPNKAVEELAPEEELLVRLPYIRPLRPDTVK
jgi:hypothetical protein